MAGSAAARRAATGLTKDQLKEAGLTPQEIEFVTGLAEWVRDHKSVAKGKLNYEDTAVRRWQLHLRYTGAHRLFDPITKQPVHTCLVVDPMTGDLVFVPDPC